MWFRLLVLASLVLFSSWAGAREMRLFLLVGQSNMAGRGGMKEAHQKPHPQIWMMDRKGEWVPARDPVHFDKPKVAGVGLCMTFAQRDLQRHPNAQIGLIPCAMGGSSLGEWMPGEKLFEKAVARAKRAKKDGRLVAILWHQGEADSGDALRPLYSARFCQMMTQMRKELHAESVPVLVGELGWFNKGFCRLNPILNALPEQVPLCAVVSSKGLKAKKDNVHFCTESLQLFGNRYYDAFLRFKKGKR